MRPLKLEIEGINSFRERQTVDFERLSEHNLFCISGVTGSGKTTILDSLILGLYERLPASTTRGNIEDYINLKCEKAEIKLTFELEGKIYRTERVISRKKGQNLAKIVDVATGVAIKEKSDDAFAFLKEKLGLDVEQFTQVVVLQQGQFAQFLKSGKADRNKMIIKLFKLDRFDNIAAVFSSASKRLNGEIELIDKVLARYEGVSAEAIDELEKELKSAEKELKNAEKEVISLRKEGEIAKENEKKKEAFDKAQVKLREINARQAALLAEGEKLSSLEQKLVLERKEVAAIRIERDGMLAQKAGLERDKAQLADIQKREEDLKRKRADLIKGQEELKNLSDCVAKKRAELEKIKAEAGEFAEYKIEEISAKAAELKLKREDKKRVAIQLENAAKLTADAEAKKTVFDDEIKRLNARFSVAKEEFEKAEKTLDEARKNAGADELKKGLKRGDVCPVCGQTLLENPDISAHSEVDFAEKNFNKKRDEFNRISEELNKATAEGAAKDQALKTARKRQVEIEEEYAKFLPDLEQKAEAVERGNKMVKAIVDATESIKELTVLAEKKSQMIEQLISQGKEDRRELDERKAKLNESDRDKLESRIKKLDEGILAADNRQKALDALVAEVEKQSKAVQAENAKILADLAEIKGALADKPAEIKVSSAVIAEKLVQTETAVSELAAKKVNLRSSADRMKADLAVKREEKAKRAELNKKLDKTGLLAKLLGRGDFNEFVANEYIKDFTFSASKTLSGLTAGKYTLSYDDGEFYVTDFLSDNEKRKVKTLSGGETFLTSLSMAIALSQEIARYGNFDFFFIDEGFGTLHEEALEQALDVLTKLSAGSLVGLVTHRTELIDRISDTLLITCADEEKGSTCKII